MSVHIRFESPDYRSGEADEAEGIYTLGPFDWIEVEGRTMTAEAEDGAVRHEELASLNLVDLCWETEDGRRWHYFVIYESED